MANHIQRELLYPNQDFYDGSGDIGGYNISAPGSVYAGSKASEFSYLYYNSLKNSGAFDLNGNFNPNWSQIQAGPFSGIQLSKYWSGTEYDSLPNTALSFSFDGGQNLDWKYEEHLAWAVRDGDTGPSASVDSPFYTTMVLGQTISFDYYWLMGEDPSPYNGQSFDVLALQGGAGWKYIGQIAAYNSSTDWLTAMIAVPQEFWGLETQIRFVLSDFGPETDPTVYLRNISSSQPVPEPASMLLFGSGVIVFGNYFRRRLKKS